MHVEILFICLRDGPDGTHGPAGRAGLGGWTGRTGPTDGWNTVAALLGRRNAALQFYAHA